MKNIIINQKKIKRGCIKNIERQMKQICNKCNKEFEYKDKRDLCKKCFTESILGKGRFTDLVDSL